MLIPRLAVNRPVLFVQTGHQYREVNLNRSLDEEAVNGQGNLPVCATKNIGPFMKKQCSLRSWEIIKDGFTFNCSYDHKNAWVEVSCYGLEFGRKNAKAGSSGPDIIAGILAGEIITASKRAK